MFHPRVQPGHRGLREAGAHKGGGAGAGDSGGAEEDEDAEVHSTRRRLVVEMGTACWPGGSARGYLTVWGAKERGVGVRGSG